MSCYKNIIQSPFKARLSNCFFAIGLLLFGIAPVSLYAQAERLEKLQQALNENSALDTARVNRLLDLSYAYELSQTEEIKKSSTEALELSRELKYVAGEARALIMLSRINPERDLAIRMLTTADSLAKEIQDYRLQFWATIRLALRYAENDNEKAIELALKSETLAKKTGDPALISRAQLRAAETYCNLSNYALAMEYSLKAQENAIAAKCVDCEMRIWGRIAAVYELVGNYEKSNFYYEKQNVHYKKIGASNVLLGQLQYNMANNYFRLAKDYEKALIHYKLSVKLDPTPFRRHVVDISMADLYVRFDSLDLAFKYAFSARTMNEGNLVTLSTINRILSDAHLKKSRYDSALFYGELSLSQATKIGNKLNICESMLSLSQSYAATGDFKKALNFHQQYLLHRDSVTDNAVKNKVALLEHTAELEKKQAEVEMLNQQKNAQQKLLLAVSASLLLVIVVALAMIKNNRQKAKYIHQKQLLVETVNTQEEVHKRISRDLHDELGAVLSMARMYLVKSRDAVNGSSEIKPVLQEACDLTEVALATMRRISHEIMPPLLEQFGFIKTLQATANQINKANQLTVDLIVSDETLRLPVATELGLYRITMELLNNTMKHANAKRISITLRADAEKLELTYLDDGIGLKNINGMGRGFSNIETRTSVMGGSFEIDKKNTRGFKATIVVPLVVTTVV